MTDRDEATAKERDVDTAWNIAHHYRESDDLQDRIAAALAAARAEEREACAKVAEDMAAMRIAQAAVGVRSTRSIRPMEIAAAIRARGVHGNAQVHDDVNGGDA